MPAKGLEILRNIGGFPDLGIKSHFVSSCLARHLSATAPADNNEQRFEYLRLASGSLYPEAAAEEALASQHMYETLESAEIWGPGPIQNRVNHSA